MVARTGLRRRMLFQCACLFCAVPLCLAFIWPATYTAVSVAIFFYAMFAQFAVSNEHPILCDVLDPKLRATAMPGENSKMLVQPGEVAGEIADLCAAEEVRHGAVVRFSGARGGVAPLCWQWRSWVCRAQSW